MNQTVRTRFAPSPTGYMHVGNIRTGLFAWLLARHYGGQFVLRIEDTDQARGIAGSIEHIHESLGWLGLTWDEGPDIGGPHAPYTQSQRLDIYKKWADKLIASGRAYVDPYTSEEVQTFREQAQKNKQAFLYRNHRPDTLDTVWDGTRPLRFKSDPKAYTWTDAVMGQRSTGPEVIDDFILVKSDGFPTYNFAHIVDDAEMQITHIIRGQEFLASTPNYLNLYEALEITPPIMASVPPIMNEAGNKKLSKRDGAKDILEYRDEGYLPEAMVNFLATLGWNDGTEDEVYSMEELVKRFRLERVQRSGARFDERRLLWLNGAHIRNIDLDDLYRYVSGFKPDREKGFWPPQAMEYEESYRKNVLSLVHERLKFFEELPELTQFFYTDLPVNPDLLATHKHLKKLDHSELRTLLQQSRDALEKTDWTVTAIQDQLNTLLEESGQKPAVLFSLIRIATTQSPASPALAESLELLGKERSLKRIDQQLQELSL